MGVDILSGSPESKSQPKYSMVLLEDGEIVSREEVNRIRLLRAFRNLKPDRVACDNLFELFPKEKIKRFFFLLPAETQLIQVNGTPEHMEPLHIVAKRNGIQLTSKASSMEEAEACARLAYMNVGYEVKAFEDQCKIIVSRARSLGKGGQSQDRYRRKVHSMVAMNIKEIQGILEEKGVKYSLEVVKADFGCSRGEFTVNLPRSKLREIKNRKGPDVQVKILPVERSKLLFEPLASEDRDVIVGVDPGTTTAIAVLDLDGNLFEVLSRRDFSYTEVLSYLSKFRDAVIIASDVNPAPRFVERISSSLNAVLYTPPQSMSVEEKTELVYQKFSRDSYRNTHERDALAAAIKAFNSWRNKLEQVDRKLEDLHLQSISRQVRRLVIRGESIDSAIKKLTKAEKIEVEEEKREEGIPDEYKGIIRSLKSEIKLLKSEREELLKAVKGKDKRISELLSELSRVKEGEYKKLRKDKEIRILKKTISDLRSELDREKKENEKLRKKLKELQNLEVPPNFAVVKLIPQFTREDVLRIKGQCREGEVFYIQDSSGGGRSAAEELLALKPKCLIADKGKMSHLAREVLRTTPILPPDSLDIKIINGFGVVEKEALEEKISEELEKIKIKEAARKEEWLETFIREYREKRRKP
jgi:hypothetical protein